MKKLQIHVLFIFGIVILLGSFATCVQKESIEQDKTSVTSKLLNEEQILAFRDRITNKDRFDLSQRTTIPLTDLVLETEVG